jgi:hypothetical protein
MSPPRRCRLWGFAKAVKLVEDVEKFAPNALLVASSSRGAKCRKLLRERGCTLSKSQKIAVKRCCCCCIIGGVCSADVLLLMVCIQRRYSLPLKDRTDAGAGCKDALQMPNAVSWLTIGCKRTRFRKFGLHNHSTFSFMLTSQRATCLTCPIACPSKSRSTSLVDTVILVALYAMEAGTKGDVAATTENPCFTCIFTPDRARNECRHQVVT